MIRMKLINTDFISVNQFNQLNQCSIFLLYHIHPLAIYAGTYSVIIHGFGKCARHKVMAEVRSIELYVIRECFVLVNVVVSVHTVITNVLVSGRR